MKCFHRQAGAKKHAKRSLGEARRGSVSGRTQLRLEPLECRRLLTATTGLRFEFDPAAGGAAVPLLAVGQDYVLKAFVQDIRSPQPATPGVLQAYFDIGYDSSLITVNGSIAHGADFQVNPDGDASVPGTLSSIGGVDTDLLPPAPSAEELLFSVPIHASQAGTLWLVPNITANPLEQVELFDSASPVPLSDIAATLNGSSLSIEVTRVTLDPIVGPDAGGVFDVPAGKDLYVPVVGSDGGLPVTYTATSSDPNVQVSVLSGNPTLQLTVDGTDVNGDPFSGTMTFQLFANIAPQTVQGIIDKVNAGLYDGASIYRMETDPTFTLIQGGILETPGKSDTTILPDEFNVDATYNSPGMLGMANAGPGTATSEFFVTAPNSPLADDPQFLNFDFTIFGQLVTGQDIYDQILNVPTSPSLGQHLAINPVTIDSAALITDTEDAVLHVWEPNDYVGDAAITVTGTGADSTTAQQSFTVSVSAPVASSLAPLVLNPVVDQTTTENQPVSFQLTAVDLVGSPTFSVSGAASFNATPPNVTVEVTPGGGNTATVTLTPAAGFTGTVNLLAHADDGSYYHDAQAFTLTVNSATVPPTPWVQYTLVAEDLQGDPLGANATVAAGTDFKLAAYVQDIRNPADPLPGVFAAVLNVAYDTSHVSVTASSHAANQPDPAFVFAPQFTLTRTGDLSTPGEITAAGAALTAPPNTTAGQRIWTLVVHADAGGIATFSPSLFFDPSNGTETLLFDPLDPNGVPSPGEPSLTPVDFSFVPLDVTIVPLGTPVVSINSVSASEGNSGTTAFVFTVSLSEGSATPVTVAYFTADGTATVANNAYDATSGTMTFAPGETVKGITVLVNGDTTIEPDETFSVNLSSAAGAVIGTPTATGTIQDDDSPLSLSISDAAINEGDSGTTPFVFTVSLSNIADTPVTVSYATADFTATVSDGDYVAQSGTLTFTPGVVSQIVSIAVLGDTSFESNESFIVNLTNPVGATLADSQGVGTILNDDAAPSLSIGGVAVDAPAMLGDTVAAVFAVTLVGITELPATVQFATVDDTAIAGIDYIATSGILTFNPGAATSQYVTVTIPANPGLAADETFLVDLASSVNATISIETGVGTIHPPSAPPAIALMPSNLASPEGQTGTTLFIFTAVLSAVSAVPVTVQYSTADGTASVVDNDYLAFSGTLTFDPGEISKQITVLVNGDTTYEPDETFSLTLGSPTNATIEPGAATANAAILNDDPQPPAIELDLNGAALGTGFTSSWSGFAALPVTIVDAANATLTDSGATNLVQLIAALASPHAGDTLTANNSGHAVVNVSFAGDTLTLSGSGSLADYQAVLRTIKYTNSAGGPLVDSLSIDLQAFDGTLLSNVATATVILPPIVDLNGGLAGTGFTAGWYDSGPVPITGMAEASIRLPSGLANLTGVTVVLSSFHAGDVLSVPSLFGITGITSSYSAGTLSLSGSNSAANYQKLLRLINYDNTSGGPGVSSMTAGVTATDGTLTSSPVTATIHATVLTGQVLGNRLFYNGSKFDNNHTAIEPASDALAIASDKIGFDGVGTASFANVSSFSKGITGVMIDLAGGLGTHGSMSLADITFHTSPAYAPGTYNELANWNTAPTPSGFSVILGGGTGGSDRIEITWNAGDIKNQWLEVDLAANAATGLAAPISSTSAVPWAIRAWGIRPPKSR